MRGKTNIPPRKNPVINGDLKNFVVANGNTITRGDFVSFQVQNIIEQTTVFDNTIPKKLFKKYIDNYYIYECANTTNFTCNYYLVKCEGDVVTVVDSIVGILSTTTYTVCQFDVYDSKLYVMTGDKKIRIYSISTNGFTYIDEMTITYSGYSTNMYGLCILDDTHLVLINYYQSSPNYTYGFLMNYDETNLSVTYKSQMFTDSQNGDYVVKKINATTCVIATSINSNSNGRKYRVVKFSNDFSTFTVAETNLPTKLLDSYDFSEDGLCFCGYCLSDKSINVMRYDTVNDRVDLLSLSLSSYFVYTASASLLTFIADNKVFVLQFYFNQTSSSNRMIAEAACVEITSVGLEVLDNKISQELTMSYINNGVLCLFCSKNLDVANIPTLLYSYDATHSERCFMWQMVEGDEISIGKITSFVEEYSVNSRKPIGFANTSGNAGSVVQVFVPPTPQISS